MMIKPDERNFGTAIETTATGIVLPRKGIGVEVDTIKVITIGKTENTFRNRIEGTGMILEKKAPEI